jgi:hypothetical protein
VLRTVFAATAVCVLAAPAYAGRNLDPASYAIGDADAYEDDYSDEFEKATEDQYKAREGKGKGERLEEKEWELWEHIEDWDPVWAAPLYHENGDHFHSLHTYNGMEAARTLAPLHFYLSFSGEMYKQDYDRSDDGEDVLFDGRHNFGVLRFRIGIPFYKAGGLEFGVKYIFGEFVEQGRSDTYWYEGRDAVIRDYKRELGSKSLEGNLKWNIWHHSDGISGFSINLKYKEPMAEHSDLLDSTSREGAANLAISIKAGITTWHINLGYVYTRRTHRRLFYRAGDSDDPTDFDRPEVDNFITGGLAGTIQIFDFMMLIGQIEGQTNAYRDELEETFNAKVFGTAMLGLRFRVGPMVIDTGLQHRLDDEEAARVGGFMAVGIKF